MRTLVILFVAFVLAATGVLTSATALPLLVDPLAEYSASNRLGVPEDARLPWTVTTDGEQHPPAPTAPTKHAGTWTLDRADPYQALLADLGSAVDPSELQVADAVSDYFRALGYNTPDLDQAGEDPLFEENNTIHYTYPLADVSGDGVDDLLLDTYCNLPGICTNLNALTDPTLINRAQYFRCGWPHRLAAASGVDGVHIWNRSLVPRMTFMGVVPYTWETSCAFSFVVGLVPFPDGSKGILVYEYGVFRPAIYVQRFIENRFLMLDPKTGETIWEKTILGTYHDSFVGGSVPLVWQADSLFVNPIIQTTSPNAIPVPEAGLTATLHLQSVGFNMTYIDTIALPQVGVDRAIQVLEQYDALEWVARLEPATGRELWRTQSFGPTVTHSILPQILNTPPYPSCCYLGFNSPGTEPSTTASNYWAPTLCCSDINGDKVPDLLYRTYEWFALPAANQDGPYTILSRVIAYDGVSGDLLYEHVVEEGTGEPILNQYWIRVGILYRLFLQGVGDVDNDGSADYAVHVVYDDAPTFLHTVSVRSGPDGAELWRLDSDRDLAILPIGQATPDGDDLLLVDWFAASQRFPNAYHFTNVTYTPLAAFNGLDGTMIWRTSTFMAPTDIVFMIATAFANGVVDLDHDQVADIPLDDPLQLPDLTIIHRFTFISGADAKPLYRLDTAGQFAFPARVADVTGDGVPDLGILNGDITDLWLTVYEGSGGQPLWSVRVLSPRASSYTNAQPRMRVHALSYNATPQQDFVLNFQLNTVSVGGGFTVSPTTPSVGVYDGIAGSIFWSLPRQRPQEIGFVNGTTPATQLYYEALVAGEELRALGIANPQAHINLLPAIASLLAGFGAAFGITRWRLAK